MGTKLAASGAASDRCRAVPGGVLGRIMAGAAVCRARHRSRHLRAAGAGCAVPAGPVSLAQPRGRAEPARSRHRRPPSPGHRAGRYAGLAGSGCTGAVAGPARAHPGIDQADSRRPAVAAACHPRSLGAARAGRHVDGCGLCGGGRRAQVAHGGGIRLERRAVAGHDQGRRLGDAAALHRQAADHPVGSRQGSRHACRRRRCRCRWAAR